jgi:hypothetical protein
MTRKLRNEPFDVTVYGIPFTGTFDAYIENDPFGTGDSPASFDIDILKVEVDDNGWDIQDMLYDSVLEQIENEIMKDLQ